MTQKLIGKVAFVTGASSGMGRRRQSHWRKRARTWQCWRGVRIDIMVNNAGVMLLHQIEGIDSGEWRQMLDLNVLAVMLACQEVLPIMQAQGGGHIVNISSVAGRGQGGL